MCFHLKHNWKQDSPLTEFQEGDLYICLEYRRVIVHEQEIALTIKEFDILLLLIMNPNRVFTYRGYHGFGLERRLHLLFPESHQ